jgi:hypothetical protein
VRVAVVMAVAVLVLIGGLADQRGLCRQDAQGPTPPTFSIVMRVRYPARQAAGIAPAPNIAVFSASSSSGAPRSSPNRTLR